PPCLCRRRRDPRVPRPRRPPRRRPHLRAGRPEGLHLPRADGAAARGDWPQAPVDRHPIRHRLAPGATDGDSAKSAADPRSGRDVEARQRRVVRRRDPGDAGHHADRGRGHSADLSRPFPPRRLVRARADADDPCGLAAVAAQPVWISLPAAGFLSMKALLRGLVPVIAALALGGTAMAADLENTLYL